MGTALTRLIVGVSFLVLIMTLLAAIALKFFARPLSLSQALLISLVASSVSVGLSVLYFLAKVTAGYSVNELLGLDSLATLVMLCVAGYLITKLAKNYGIKKTGWLGVGAKSMLAVLAMSWVLVGVITLVAWL